MNKEIRCAIYTRKSTEEGLEQKFNSLDAQRLSGESYVLSRQHEGWTIVEKEYNDGGYSGGNLNRPALQELFKDIKAEKIDCVVVYKIDRLSRSLLDFAKMLELFNNHEVTFVSITQSFNTTDTAGRLMLNIMLSFAQYEREITIDRVKDKIAMSKKKGLRMGGRAPLGYDTEDKKLVINAKEAELVRHIFKRFETLTSFVQVTRELNEEGYRTKRYQDKEGTLRGEQLFKKATVRRIITNPVYIGKVEHEGTLYKGQHERIIDEELWNRTQAIIEKRPVCLKKYEDALLKGKIRCAKCNVSMEPTYTRKGIKHYRYYVCHNHAHGDHCSSLSRTIAAGEIEREVEKQVRHVLQNTENILDKEVPRNLEKLNEMWKDLFPIKQQEIIKQLINTVWIREEGIEVLIRLESLKELCKVYGEMRERSVANTTDIVVGKEEASIFVKLKLKKQASRCMILAPENELSSDKTDNTLLKGLVRAHLWRRQIKEEKYATTRELCTEINIRHIQRILRLNYLAPKIKEDILNGTQPRNLRLADLKKIPLLWEEQIRVLYGQ